MELIGFIEAKPRPRLVEVSPQEVEMLKRKITRAEFLKTGFLGALAFLALPLLRIFNNRSDVSQKDARYYKNLAG